ncbi:MAG TPA: pilus assembly protein TadG-related protein [Allosphingosinicella sp.]
MAFLKRLKSIGRDTSGNALALCAVAMPLMIGGAGLAIDSVQISLARRELQRAADSAALAGAYAINQNPTATGTVRTTYAQNGATRDLVVNNDVTLSGAALVQNAPTAGTYANNTNAVRVQLSANRTLSFLSFFDATPQAITVEATAAIVREGDFCMLALEDGNVPGVTVGGNADIDISCGISTNSRSATAITATGSSTVNADPIMAVGGVPTSGNFGGATLIPYSAVQSDPFAGLPAPSPSNCRAAPESKSNGPEVNIGTNSPGYNATDRSICYNGFNIKGEVNFSFPEPTIVYINGGILDIGAQATVTGHNAVFVLTSTNATTNPNSIATVDIGAGADVNITAPSSGPYAGVAIYMDRRAPVGRTVKWNGGADMRFNGALYMPSAYFEYNGNADMANQCIQLIARRLDFRGNGSVSNSCPAGGSTQNFKATYVRLVG